MNRYDDAFKQEISRQMLYNLIAKHIDMVEQFLALKHNKDFIRNVFEGSATFAHFFEKDLTIDKDYSLKEFDALIKKALSNIREETLKEYISLHVLEKMDEKFKGKKSLTFKAIVAYLFRTIADYHNDIIEKCFYNVLFEKSDKKNDYDRPQTFLSYAYVDKGVTLGLFLYFLLHGGFLYVNWMWSGVNLDAGITKAELDKALSQSSQFLFLRTPNSDLKLKGNQTIRQWCSWEIGNYYNKGKDKKFYIDFYGSDKKNDLLFTFNTFHGVSDGIIF